MNKIKIITSHNVPIDLELALVGERMIANVLDLLLIGGYFISIYIITGLLGLGFSTVGHIVISLPAVFYNLGCMIMMEGQTFGMRNRNIKVIRLDGRELGIGDYLTRWLFRLVDVTISAGAIAILTITLTKKGQRLGDIAAGTTVVKIDREVSQEDTIFAETGENYQVKFENVNQLNDYDISIIKEVISTYQKTKSRKALVVLSKKVKEKLNLESNLPPEVFLDTVIKDYNHVTSGY